MTDIGGDLPRRRPSQEVEFRVPITDRATRATVAAWKQVIVAVAGTVIAGALVWVGTSLSAAKEDVAVLKAAKVDQADIAKETKAELKSDMASMRAELNAKIDRVGDTMDGGLKEITKQLLRMRRGDGKER